MAEKPHGLTGQERAEYIKRLLADKGYTLSALARETKTNLAYISRIVNSHTKDRRIAMIIANIVGRKVSFLWPRTYQCPHFIDHEDSGEAGP